MTRLKNFLKKLKWPAIIFAVVYFFAAIPEIQHKNDGESKSIGSVRAGKLENAWLVPFSGKNFKFFSGLSYFVFNNGYTHSKTCRTILDAYKICETTCPGIFFRIDECSDKNGGKMLIHRTHQNGMSVDFMTPKKRGASQSTILDHLGYFDYLQDFDENGRFCFAKSIQLDFETMARHILALDDSARKNGLRINKVIFMLELKDDFYATLSGKKVKERGIYFAQNLPYWTNRVHDDHYHVDFEEIN